LRAVQKRYDTRLVLEIDALDILPGEVFALVGPSGSGKSTLLRLLNFLEYPTSGSISFEGSEYQEDNQIPLAQRRRVTTVFQRPMLLERSVWENVVYGLRLRGQRDAHNQTMAALEQVGLAHLAHQRARTLSGGEAQRVALARALVLNPQALLLDEPTANLDPHNVSIIEDIVSKLNQQHKVTCILVTHNVFQARRLAQRVGFLLEGRLVEVAVADQFFESPSDERTLAFVRGEMVY
jgi:tungstate transport system ATP-binding protein